MNLRTFAFRLSALILLASVGLLHHSQAQSIATGTISPTSYCGGTQLSVPYTPTGFATPPSSYTVQLSDASGSFASPTNLAPSGLANPLVVIIPTNQPSGSGYRVRVVSAGPTVLGTTSATTLTITPKPTAPSVATTTFDYCVGSTATALSATASGGNTLRWYETTSGSRVLLAGAPTPSTAAAGNQSYEVTQLDGSCESDGVAISVTIRSIPAAPTVSSPIPYCQNAPSVPLTASGLSLRWYNTATGGTGNPTAPTPSTTTVGTTDFYVTQTVSSCESPRARIDVTINPNPAAPAVVSPINFCFGAAASPLTATASIGGTLNWYSTSSGGTALPSIVPSTTAGANYFVSQTVNGCEGPRATLSVTVTQTPPPTVASPVEYCLNAPATPLTATGPGLLWYTAASGGTGSATAPTPPTTAAGTTDYYVSSTTSGCESTRALIRVIVRPIPAAPSVTSPVNLCQNSPAGPLTASGSNLRWYTAATGGASSSAAPTPSTTTAGTTSFYVSQTVDGCESPRSQIDAVVKSLPPAPAVTSPVAYCIGVSATPLTATGTSLRWYTTATGGAGSSTAPTPSTAAAGTTLFYVSQTVDGCEGPRSTISVVVNQTALPAVTTPIEYCAGQTPPPLMAAGTDLRWYTTSTGGTPNSTAPTPSTAAVGTTNFYVTSTANGCESGRALIQVVVKAVPAAITTTGVTYCQNSAATSLITSVSGVTGTLLWYVSASGGAGATTAPTPSTATSGSSTFFVTQTVNGCESPRASIGVTVNPTPMAPVAAATTVEYCQEATATPLSATALSGNTLRWYTVASGGTANTTAPTPPTLTATTLRYYVSQANSSNCESPRTEITVQINALPATPNTVTPVQYCHLQPAAPLSVTPSATTNTFRWYTAATGGTPTSTTTPTPNSAIVGTQQFYVSQVTNKGCESKNRSEIIVNIRPLPARPTVSTPDVFCENTPTTIARLNATGTSLRWYVNDTLSTGSTIAPTINTSLTNRQEALRIYYVSQTNSFGCESPRERIEVAIKPLPLRPEVVSPVEYCVNATSFPLSAVGSELKWYTAPVGGTANTNAPTPPTTSIGVSAWFVSQTTNYTVKATAVSCEGPRATLNVIINGRPGVPSVTSQVECQTRQAEQLPFVATGQNLQWYLSPTGGTPSTTVPSVNRANAAVSMYYVSQVNDKGCEGERAPVSIRIKPLPAQPTVSAVEYCQFDAPRSLTATPVASGILNWYGTNATGGVRTDVAPTPSTDQGGVTNFYVSQSLEGCEGDRTELRVTVKTTPMPTTTEALEYCQNATATPLTATGTSLKWYRNATGGESQATPFTPFTAVVGNYSFFVTQTGDNGCESPRREIKITIKSLPSATISGTTSISLGQSAVVSIAFTSSGPWKYTLSTGETGETTSNPARITVSPRTTTTYAITSVSNACGEGTPIGSAIVTVRVPTISTGNPNTANLCAGRSFRVPFQASGDFVTGNTFVTQIATSNTSDAFRTIPSVREGNEIVATVPDTTRGGNYFVRVIGASPQFQIEGSVSPVSVTVRGLPTAELQGTTTILEGESATLTIRLTGDSPWNISYNNGSRDTLFTTSANPYAFVVRPAATTTYTMVSVSNACGTGRVSGNARIQVDPILGLEPTLSSHWITAYPNPTQTRLLVELPTSSSGSSRLTVSDLSGRLIHEQHTHQSVAEIDLSAQPAGMYLLRVTQGSRSAVLKIIKE